MAPAAGPAGHQVVRRSPTPIAYRHSTGFAAMEEARLSPEVYQFLASMVPNPGPGMWYASSQSYGNRLEATVLAVDLDCLVVVTGTQPVRRDGSTPQGRPKLRRAGPWELDYVKLPFRPGTCHVTNLPPGPATVAGGVRPGIDSHPDLSMHLPHLPATVQDHLERCVPSSKRIRRWVKALGPTAAEPERFWLFVTSTDQIAYLHAARWHPRDPSGFVGDPAGAPWNITILTAIIGPATRRQSVLHRRPGTETLQGSDQRRALPGRAR